MPKKVSLGKKKTIYELQDANGVAVKEGTVMDLGVWLNEDPHKVGQYASLNRRFKSGLLPVKTDRCVYIKPEKRCKYIPEPPMSDKELLIWTLYTKRYDSCCVMSDPFPFLPDLYELYGLDCTARKSIYLKGWTVEVKKRWTTTISQTT